MWGGYRTDYCIWHVRRCQAREQYAALKTPLREMDDGFLSSMDPPCAITGAVFFWFAELNVDYIDTIKRRKVPCSIRQLSFESWIEGLSTRNRARTLQLKQGVDLRSVCHMLWKSSRAQISAWVFCLHAAKGEMNSNSCAYISQAGIGTRI